MLQCMVRCVAQARARAQDDVEVVAPADEHFALQHTRHPELVGCCLCIQAHPLPLGNRM